MPSWRTEGICIVSFSHISNNKYYVNVQTTWYKLYLFEHCRQGWSTISEDSFPIYFLNLSRLTTSQTDTHLHKVRSKLLYEYGILQFSVLIPWLPIGSFWRTDVVKIKELNILSPVIIDYFCDCKQVYINPTNSYQKSPW